jgi:hypothetical protein
MAIDDFKKFAFVVESATSIAEIICRYAIFEDVYLQSPSAAADELQRALVKFYAAIMIYLSKARSYFDQNTACKFDVFVIEHVLMALIVRRLKSGLLAESHIESYFDAIAAAQENVDRCSNMVAMQGTPARQDIYFLYLFANEPRMYQPTHGLEKTSRVHRWPNRKIECGFGKYQGWL